MNVFIHEAREQKVHHESEDSKKTTVSFMFDFTARHSWTPTKNSHSTQWTSTFQLRFVCEKMVVSEAQEHTAPDTTGVSQYIPRQAKFTHYATFSEGLCALLRPNIDTLYDTCT
jgi:hypothetical protein